MEYTEEILNERMEFIINEINKVIANGKVSIEVLISEDFNEAMLNKITEEDALAGRRTIIEIPAVGSIVAPSTDTIDFCADSKLEGLDFEIINKEK